MPTETHNFENHDIIKDKYKFFKYSPLFLIILLMVDGTYDNVFPHFFSSFIYKAKKVI